MEKHIGEKVCSTLLFREMRSKIERKRIFGQREKKMNTIEERGRQKEIISILMYSLKRIKDKNL